MGVRQLLYTPQRKQDISTGKTCMDEETHNAEGIVYIAIILHPRTLVTHLSVQPHYKIITAIKRQHESH